MAEACSRVRLGAAVLVAMGGCLPSLADNPAREPNRMLPGSFGGRAAAEARAAAGGQAGDEAGASAAAPVAGAAAAPTAGGADAVSAAQRTWAQLFPAPELRELVESAVAHNQELNIGLQEIVIAQTEVSARRGEYLPRLGAGVGAGLEKVGRYTSQGASDDATGVPKNLGDFSFGLYGSWELDIWRRLRDARDAADVRYMASIEARNFLVTQVVAEVLRSYYELLAIDAQIDILHRNIAVQTDALNIVALEKEAARVTELAVQRFEAEVLKNRGRAFALQQQRVQVENRINFLAGRLPQPVRPALRQFDDALPQVVQAGVPAELLQNRPDVRQAELVLGGSKLDVRVARAAFFPGLSIDAAIGYRAFNAAHLVTTPDSLVYNVAGRLLAPLLNRSAIAAEYRAANARQIQAVLGYERTLLQAFTDVANQLAMIDNLGQTYALRAEQVATLGRAVDVSGTLFQSARADYMEVLLTRRDFLDAQMELVETKRQQFQAVVALYQALGGGWRAAG